MKNPLISVIIPTYNRPEDLKMTLESIKSSLREIREILIIDQSNNNSTKKLIKELNDKKIKYFYSKVPSITIARNLGIKNCARQSEIICFLDDDVTVKADYFKEVTNFFKTNRAALGLGGYFSGMRDSFFLKILNNLFFLRSVYGSRADISGAYGNNYPYNLKKVINSEWLPGVNMCYKREVFKHQKFDENLLGYTIAEDVDFSYRIHKRFPRSLFITPFAKIEHRGSLIERVPTEKLSYINQIDHFYFFLKDLNESFIDKLKLFWSLTGISLFRTIKLIVKPNKLNYLKWKYFFKSLFYCLRNIANIRKGKLRTFISN